MSVTAPAASLYDAPLAESPARFCERCGYDLRGLPDDRCPECGLRFDPQAAPAPRIPWLHRRQIGRPRAFWRTVGFVTLAPRAFAAEFLTASRVAPADARGFKRVCEALAVASCLLVLATLFFASGGGPRGAGSLVFFIGTALAAWLFFALLAAGSPFDPLRAQDTGENLWLGALNAYASAPLAFTPIAGLCTSLAILVARLTPGRTPESARWLLLAALAAVLCQAATLWTGGLSMIRQVTRCTPADLFWHGLGLIIRWVMMALLAAMTGLALLCPLSALAAAFEG